MQRATILHTLPDLQLGGGQMLLLRLIEQLEDHDHIVVGLGDGDLRPSFEGVANAVEVIGPSKVVAATRLSAIIRGHHVDLVHTNNTPDDRLIGQIGATTARVPVVNTFHSLPTLHTGRSGRLRRSANRLLSASPLVSYTAVSRHVADLYTEALKIDPEQITVIHPGIAVDDVASATEPPADVPPRPADGIRFVSVGRLTSAKRTELLIEAMHVVQSAGSVPGADLLIVGDGAERHDLERRVEELGLSNVVHLLGQRNDVGNILNHGDIFVSATRIEGFGMAPVEAMACGLPVVVCDIPVFREFLDDSVGRLVTPDGLATAMVELANDEATRAELSIAARCRAAHFTIERYADEVAAVYASRLHRPRPLRRTDP